MWLVPWIGDLLEAADPVTVALPPALQTLDRALDRLRPAGDVLTADFAVAAGHLVHPARKERP